MSFRSLSILIFVIILLLILVVNESEIFPKIVAGSAIALTLYLFYNMSEEIEKLSNRKCCECHDFHLVENDGLINPNDIPVGVPMYRHY